MLDQYIAEKKLEDKEAREKQASQKWCGQIDWFCQSCGVHCCHATKKYW
jgi:hypothetical protein